MYIERKQDLSVYHYLVDLFSDAPFVNISDGFPADNLQLPCVSVEADTINLLPLELGNRHGYQARIWRIDVYGENKSQRDEYSYRILNNIEDNIPVYDYDEGFPPDVSPTKIGCLQPSSIKMEIIRIDPNLVSKLYWRATVSFVATYESFV